MSGIKKVGEIAAAQHGVFTRTQARDAGVTRGVVARRVRVGVWIERTNRVLAVVGAPDSLHARLLIAVLHVGHGAVASHRAAAALHRIPGFPLGETHVTRPPDRHWHPPPDGSLHVSPLPCADVVQVDGIPCTSASRTVFDLAGTERFEQRVERALDNALAMRLTTVAQLNGLVARSRGRPGVVLMRRLLEARADAYVPPASELEARFLQLVRAAGLPEPERQVAVGGVELAGRVDMVWRDARLVAELDSRRHHSALLHAAEDARRDVAAARGGWATIRIWWDDVFGYPERTMDRLTAALTMRRAS